MVVTANTPRAIEILESLDASHTLVSVANALHDCIPILLIGCDLDLAPAKGLFCFPLPSNGDLVLPPMAAMDRMIVVKDIA